MRGRRERVMEGETREGGEKKGKEGEGRGEGRGRQEEGIEMKGEGKKGVSPLLTC
jgi:hypothetical protein